MEKNIEKFEQDLEEIERENNKLTVELTLIKNKKKSLVTKIKALKAFLKQEQIKGRIRDGNYYRGKDKAVFSLYTKELTEFYRGHENKIYLGTKNSLVTARVSLKLGITSWEQLKKLRDEDQPEIVVNGLTFSELYWPEYYQVRKEIDKYYQRNKT